jgi:NAD(P)-dependent dehydrogenase (short-subunit alcohol dehydrogenase family)
MRTTDPGIIDFKKKFDLTDKVIVITGACGLIGRAFCEAAAQFGAHIICADIPLAKPGELAHELEKKHGRKMLGVELNVAVKKEVIALKEQVLSAFGKIDGLGVRPSKQIASEV